MPATSALAFEAAASATAAERFDLFVVWAEPDGVGGFNSVHRAGYSRTCPWFEYSAGLLPSGHNSVRSWFIRKESLDEKGIFNLGKNGVPPKIFKPECLIPDSRFLHFAKAYVNIMAQLKELRSPPKSTVKALIFLEHELRALNHGRNDPELLNHLCFSRAATAVLNSSGNPSSKYDVGQELEVLAGMLQGGYHSKTFRYQGHGFKLLREPFVFTSAIPQRPRKGVTPTGDEEPEPERMLPISSEAVAAVGIAYADATMRLGSDHAAALMAALPGLALTTTSMRISDLVELRSDAVFKDADTGRTRIRIFRPKTNVHQNLPVPKKLAMLSTKFFETIHQFGSDARDAFSFYLKRFDDRREDIDQLYIPEHYRSLLEREVLTCDEAWQALGFPGTSSGYFPQRFNYLPISRAVRQPDGTLCPLDISATEVTSIGQVIVACQTAGIKVKPEIQELGCRYLSRAQAYSYMGCSRERAMAALAPIFKSPITTVQVIKTADLMSEMLKDFKAMSFPNWPYTSKSRTLRLDQALLVWSEQNSDSECQSGNQTRLWWRPTLISIGTINSWICGSTLRPPILFESLGIHLANGLYPSITVHQTRKRHHTKALLAGVNETLADQLAGRTSGSQSGHYDKRTAHQILAQSIEGFDPDADYDAIGPVMQNAPASTRIVERRVFMFDKVAPKQVTDVGGCRSDWSLNPCEMFGDCMRCNKSVWRKGDQKRLPRITQIHDDAQQMLVVGRERMQRSPHVKPIARHVRQFEETIFRCEWIFAVEADPAIAIGTIVTFDAGPTAFTSSELASYLRQRQAATQKSCACN